MIVLADRNFAAHDLLTAIADTGADLLVRVKIGRRLPVGVRLPDHSYLSRIGALQVRVITATITVRTTHGQRNSSPPVWADGYYAPAPRAGWRRRSTRC